MKKSTKCRLPHELNSNKKTPIIIRERLEAATNNAASSPNNIKNPHYLSHQNSQISNIAAELNEFSNALFNRQQLQIQNETQADTSLPINFTPKNSPSKLKSNDVNPLPSSVKIVTQTSANEQQQNHVQNDISSENLSVQDIIEHFQQYNKRNSSNHNENSPTINKVHQTNFAALAYRPNNATSPIVFQNVRIRFKNYFPSDSSKI